MARFVVPTILLLFTAVSAPAPILEPSPSEQAKPKRSEAKAAPKENTSAPVDQKAIETKLKDLENRWEASFTTHDPSVIESVVANDFAGVYWDGKVMNRSSVLSSFKKDMDTYQSAVNEQLSVHVSSPTTAVVIGTAHEKGVSRNGQPFDRMFRFTDTWTERHGRWQCTASQVTKIPLQ
jgi:hypothetical protein